MADTIKTNLGPVTAYADAKAHGYTGTRDEFGQLLAGAAGNLRDAVSAKEGAEVAKQAAETAQHAAAENQKNAETQAANAKASADSSAEQADAAKESATGAANSASAAQESETNAGLSATAAANAESAAKQAQQAAETAKTDAETAKTAAGNSADAAANSAADAKKTLEAIPADYSTLSGKVDENTSGIRELKEDLGIAVTYTDVTGNVITGSAIDTRESHKGAVTTSFPKAVCTNFIDVSDKTSQYLYSGWVYFFLGIAGYDSDGNYIGVILDAESDINTQYTDFALTIPSNVSKIRATSYPTSSSINASVKIVKRKKTNAVIDDIVGLQKSRSYKMNHIYVAKNGNDSAGNGTKTKPYATIYHANEMIIDASEDNRYTIHVADGIYTDLQARYAGKYSGKYEGVICKDYVFYEGNVLHPENCVISWNGAIGFESETEITQVMIFDKAPFHITNGHTGFKGFKFACKNLRYPTHIECSGLGIDNEWYVSDCLYDWDGRPDVPNATKSAPVFGMGTGYFEKGIIKNCKILKSLGTAYIGGLQTHDGYFTDYGYVPFMYVGCNLKIENCNFGNNKIELRTRVNEKFYDVPNLIEFINCVGISKIYHSFLAPASGYEQAAVREWEVNFTSTNPTKNNIV